MSSEEELADTEGAQCQCGHTATMRCPDCGQPICEECALDLTVPLWPQGLESLASGRDTFWFCQRCAPAEEQLTALAEEQLERTVTEWLDRLAAQDYYTAGEEEDREGRDYYCYQCGVWLSQEMVDTYNDELDPEGEGPTICPTCQYEVVWWSTPEGMAIKREEEPAPEEGTE